MSSNWSGQRRSSSRWGRWRERGTKTLMNESWLMSRNWNTLMNESWLMSRNWNTLLCLHVFPNGIAACIHIYHQLFLQTSSDIGKLVEGERWLMSCNWRGQSSWIIGLCIVLYCFVDSPVELLAPAAAVIFLATYQCYCKCTSTTLKCFSRYASYHCLNMHNCISHAHCKCRSALMWYSLPHSNAKLYSSTFATNVHTDVFCIYTPKCKKCNIKQFFCGMSCMHVHN